ncbi:hypothetical protein NUW58_g1204 [Xylaria curta]|uniref:Uncharacterized protein n=1 Tax=Xylaria curta TaxID=42375 RepID=A0ACC1PLD0_9PEZI|nr:hypothetical protein NUW58_g1204 [Xylaria curta]
MTIARRKLFVFLDGTWQDGVNNNSPLTNVATLARCLESQASDGSPQIVYYSSGVGNGTSRPAQLIDAATGRGISTKVREAYSFLSHNYNFMENKDEIYLIGFSRGAFAAQCLASFISQTGLIPKEYLYYLRGLFTLWASQKIKKVLNELEKKREVLEKSGALRKVEIKALALWDTVSSLGIPIQLRPRPLAFVGEEVPKCVRHAFQALALDEERRRFLPVVWRSKGANTKVSQCWFLGGHGDVGGSEDAALGMVSLVWMIGRLHQLGVSFNNQEISKHMKSKYLDWDCSVNRVFKKVKGTPVVHHLPREVKATEPGWYWRLLGRRARSGYLQPTMADIPGSQIFDGIHFTVGLTKQHNSSQYNCRALSQWKIDTEIGQAHGEQRWRLVNGAQGEVLDEHDLTANDEEFKQLKSWCTPPPPERESKTDRTAFAEKVIVSGSEEELEKFRKFLKDYIDGLEEKWRSEPLTNRQALANTFSMTLRKNLQQAKQVCNLTKREHIRPDIIRNIITAERVKKELPTTWGRWLFPCWDWELEDKVQQASKVIAILVLIGRFDAIDDLLRDGLTDDHLPLVKDENCVRSQCGTRSFESFNTCRGHRDLADMFLETQWDVWAPSLDFKAGNLTPIPLQSSSTLPFDYEEVATTTYSEVYKGTLWPSHYRGFKDKPRGQVCVAIKKFRDGPKGDESRHYREELANLELIQMIEDEHLSKPWACCEETRCIFFPWAGGGDLWDFWDANNQKELERTPDVFLWALRQITGLTHALDSIHRAKTRHGDLKPSNILHFTDGNTKLGTLKIADFGVSRTHKIETGLRKNPTITKASTFIYEAPEAHEPFKDLLSRSRRYDCWSMGCIILEFVIWLLYDFPAITSCMGERDPPDHAYYRRIPGSDPRTKIIEAAMEVHPVVNDAVREMKTHIWFENTAVEAVVKLVMSDLLKIKPEKRLGAGDTHKALQVILATAQKDMSTFAKAVDPTLPVPSIFNQQGRKASPKPTYE